MDNYKEKTKIQQFYINCNDFHVARMFISWQRNKSRNCKKLVGLKGSQYWLETVLFSGTQFPLSVEISRYLKRGGYYLYNWSMFDVGFLLLGGEDSLLPLAAIVAWIRNTNNEGAWNAFQNRPLGKHWRDERKGGSESRICWGQSVEERTSGSCPVTAFGDCGSLTKGMFIVRLG